MKWKEEADLYFFNATKHLNHRNFEKAVPCLQKARSACINHYQSLKNEDSRKADRYHFLSKNKLRRLVKRYEKGNYRSQKGAVLDELVKKQSSGGIPILLIPQVETAAGMPDITRLLDFYKIELNTKLDNQDEEMLKGLYSDFE